ncbi:MAG: hypothetical protein ACLTW9_06675, partial [Enterocloster sp.]
MNMASYRSQGRLGHGAFELGINVIETWDGDRLYGKALAFLAAVLEARPDKQVFVTDMYYNRYDFEGDKRAAPAAPYSAARQLVLSGQYGGDRLHYISRAGVHGYSPEAVVGRPTPPSD